MALAFCPLITIRPAFQQLENQLIVEEKQSACCPLYLLQTDLDETLSLVNAVNKANKTEEEWLEQAASQLTVHHARLGAAPP